MAKLICVVFPAVLLILRACGERSHACEGCHTHTYAEKSPTHFHTLERWAEMNLNCSNKTEVVLLAKTIIDEFKDSYTQTEESPKHPHTLGRWTGVTGKNLSCGNVTDVVNSAKTIVDFIDEFKDNYIQTVTGGWSWDVVDKKIPTKCDNLSIQVCMEDNKGCIPVLPYLPPYTPPQNELEMKAQMVEMIGFLLRYSVAAETLVLDQSLAEENVNLLEMAQLQSDLEGLIDVFLVPLTSCNLTPHPNLVMELGRRMHQRAEDDTLREIRDFMGLRQIRLGLLYIYNAYVSETCQTSLGNRRG